MRWLTAYLATAATMLVMDFSWLTSMFGYYRAALGPLLRPQTAIGPAILFYLVYVAGVVLFVVMPALRTGGWRSASAHGAAFGVVAYATYDLTNLSTLNGFPLNLALVDISWGLVITGVSATVGYAVARKFG